MAGTGWKNPMPALVGGAPAATEQVYLALRVAVGPYGCSTEGTFEDMWRAAKATALAAAASIYERAFNNAFPSRSTDWLPYFERVLGVVPPEGSNATQRRIVVTALWNARSDASGPAMQDQLQAIDSRFQTIRVDPANALVTWWGRAIEPYDGSDPMGLAGPGTEFPACSSHNRLHALMELGSGVLPTGEEADAIQAANNLMGDVLPAWCDHQVATHIGFVLDESLLDVTGFGE